MEFFILGLIAKMGLTSLYAFRQEAELEPGGIRSALETLEKRHLITRAEPGFRNRREMKLTPEGNEFFNRFWTQCLRPHADAESVLRSALVAWFMESPGAAAAYLESTAETRRGTADEARMRAKYMQGSQTDPLSTYIWMRILTEAHRRRAEAEAFLSFSQFLMDQSTPDVHGQS